MIRKSKRLGKTRNISNSNNQNTQPNEPFHQPVKGWKPNRRSGASGDYWLNCFIIVLAISTLAALGYYLFKLVRAYLRAKKVKTVIQLVSPQPTRVGETLTCRIRFREADGRLVSSSTDLFKDLRDNTMITIKSTDGGEQQHDIAIIKEASADNNFILGKFSLRRSGCYEVSVRYLYHIFKLPSIPPFMFVVYPGLPSYKNIDFGMHNPNVLCLTADVPQPCRISCNDEYGNRCAVEDVDLSKFAFRIFHMGNELTPETCEFCHYEDGASSSSSSSNNINQTITSPSITIGLKLKVTDPGVYVCALSYDSYEVPHKQGAPKLIVCITPEEEVKLKDIFSQTTILPGMCLTTCPCKVTQVGVYVQNSIQLYAGVSYSSLAFATHKMYLLLYPEFKFPVNGKTIVRFSWSQYRDDDIEAITFLIEDGLRPSIWVELPFDEARVLLLVFAHAQGHSFPKPMTTFQDMKTLLKYQMTPYLPSMPWLNPEKTLIIQPGNLIRSSIAAAPSNLSDWHLPFIIKYDSGVAAGSRPPVQDWLNLLCEEYFGEKGKFFGRSAGSKLLHPIPSSVSRHPVEYYKFCGKIIGKCIVEVLLRGACTRLSGVKFTKSFLSYMLGLPVHYKFLETDEPSYFHEIKHLLETDISLMDIYFTTLPPSSPSNANIVNLIPNGSELKVSDENKEHYLNLLTKYRLIHTVEQEISAIRAGFYDVIDKDYLCNFKADDLQMLISGGCPFNVNDLRKYHRVVREVGNGYAPSTNLPTSTRRTIDDKKLMNWLFAAIQNMSEKEKIHLLYFTTGSFSLPSCGFKDLNPLFTINLTGTFNHLPMGNPISNEIILGDFISFEKFERLLLHAIKPESERIALPQTTYENRLSIYAYPLLKQQQQREQDEIDEYNELTPISLDFYETDDDGSSHSGDRESAEQVATTTFARDPFLNWLREFVNL